MSTPTMSNFLMAAPTRSYAALDKGRQLSGRAKA
jgi:hypothetical protein